MSAHAEANGFTCIAGSTTECFGTDDLKKLDKFKLYFGASVEDYLEDSITQELVKHHFKIQFAKQCY